jgi:hypothetical protein
VHSLVCAAMFSQQSVNAPRKHSFWRRKAYVELPHLQVSPLQHFPLDVPFRFTANFTSTGDDLEGFDKTTSTSKASKSLSAWNASSETVSTASIAKVRPWNLTAAELIPPPARPRPQTPRQPNEGIIDLLGLGEYYIQGHVGSNATFGSNASPAGAMGPKKRGNKQDGPIQCGPGQPCKDNSCCSKDGKCGYKQGHCGDGCQSNCTATAMCGIDSADHRTPCALKLCCSYYGWCGTEAVHCYDPEPQYGKTPCQTGYGACAITPSPTCGKGSRTASGRRVGYYQGWNSRERACDKVLPGQINTRGLTHLFFAFAFFDSTTFQIMPMHQEDIKLYGDFTSLKRNGLQTWIAIGGVSLSFTDYANPQ